MRQEERQAVIENYIGAEDGDLFLYYRPAARDVRGVADVERLCAVFHPLAQSRYRLLEFDRPVLPSETGLTGVVRGRVANVDEKEAVIRGKLGPVREPVAGSAPVVKRSAVPCAEGVYTLVRHGNQTHLVYLLELPPLPFGLQQQLGIRTEDEFLMGVYNPRTMPEEQGAGQPELPLPLQDRFRRQITLYDDIVDLLDYERMRFLLQRKGQAAAREHAADVAPLWQDIDTAEVFAKLAARKQWRAEGPIAWGQWR